MCESNLPKEPTARQAGIPRPPDIPKSVWRKMCDWERVHWYDRERMSSGHVDWIRRGRPI